MTKQAEIPQEIDSEILTAAISGADVLVDSRSKTFHAFNQAAKDALDEERQKEIDGGSPDFVRFLRALITRGLVLWAVTRDGNVGPLKDGPCENADCPEHGRKH